MRRRFFTILAAASLLLGVTMLFIMALADWPQGRLHFLGDDGWHHQWFIEFDGSDVSLCRWPTYLHSISKITWIALFAASPSVTAWAWNRRVNRPPRESPRPRKIGKTEISGYVLIYSLSALLVLGLVGDVAITLPLGVLAIWAALAFLIPVKLEERRLERSYSGRCPNRGYDLRATPERCPECGTVKAKVRR